VVDIHSHILPATDDGAESLEQSLEMLRLAESGGTTDIIATPHANELYAFDESTVQAAFDSLRARAGVNIRVHLGCELHLNYVNLQRLMRRPLAYTLHRSRYLLLELPNVFSVQTVAQTIRELIGRGLVPVIAHPERNVMVQQQMRELPAWKKMGCLMQVTGQALMGGFGGSAKRAADEMMKQRLVDFVASDAHDCHKRPPELRRAYEHVASRYGAAVAEQCFVSNPAAVLANRSLPFTSSSSRGASELFHSGLSFLRSIKNAGRPVARK
jgi:protein-tyrosine phosphatase